MTVPMDQDEVTALVRDFDHTQPRHAGTWRDTFSKLRAHCPRARSEKHGGFWLASNYRDVLGVAQSPDFTSEKIFDADAGTWRGGDVVPVLQMRQVLPTEASNESWRGYRTFLNRRFNPNAVETRRPVAQGVVRTLVDRFIESGKADLVTDLTNPLPAIVTMEMFGFSLDNWHDFAEPVHQYMYTHEGDPEYEAVYRKLHEIIDRLLGEAEDRKRNPTDDLMSYLVHGEIDGRPVTNDEVGAMALNLMLGGVDTTTALTSNVLHYLGLEENADKRQQLIADPALRKTAREEFVRYFSPVHGFARTALADTEVEGWEIGQGEVVYCAVASANYDETVFEDADTIRLDRHPNRHVGFGAGMHHCLGLHLARVMFDIMLDEVLLRLPDYRVTVGEEKRYPIFDKINGWSRIPVTFTPGKPLGGGISLG